METLKSLRLRGDAILARSAEMLGDTRLARFTVDTLRAVVAVARGFRGERISLRASALTYISIFSLVPTLAVALALVDAVGRHHFHQSLRSFVFSVLAPGIREDTAALLDRFLNSASAAAAGGAGFVILAISAGSLLQNLDSSLNEIWSVRRKRPWPLRIAVYAAILVIGPLLMAVSVAGMGVLAGIVSRYLPFPETVLTVSGGLVAVAGFTLLYLVAPNAPVRFRSALAGGLVAGLGWDLAKHLYSGIASWTFKTSPIWGSLGAVPLFLTWIYVSWLLLLFGARLAFAVQHAWLRRGIPELAAFPRTEALIGARLVAALAERCLSGEPAVSLRVLARDLGTSPESLSPIVEPLVRGGVLNLLSGGKVEPSRPLNELTLADVAVAMGGGALFKPANPQDKTAVDPLQALLDGAEANFLESLQKIRWDALPGLARGLPERPQMTGAVSDVCSPGQKP